MILRIEDSPFQVMGDMGVMVIMRLGEPDYDYEFFVWKNNIPLEMRAHPAINYKEFFAKNRGDVLDSSRLNELLKKQIAEYSLSEFSGKQDITPTTKGVGSTSPYMKAFLGNKDQNVSSNKFSTI